MLTLNTILKELKDIPVDRLEDIYSVIHSLKTDSKKSELARKKILSFAGAFKDMSHKCYKDLIKETKKTRTILFDREINL